MLLLIVTISIAIIFFYLMIKANQKLHKKMKANNSWNKTKLSLNWIAWLPVDSIWHSFNKITKKIPSKTKEINKWKRWTWTGHIQKWNDKMILVQICIIIYLLTKSKYCLVNDIQYIDVLNSRKDRNSQRSV